jgi:DNA-binding transcriptional ArsR family regulator
MVPHRAHQPSTPPQADVLKIVSEPRRREILRLVWTDERSAGDIAREFNITFGGVSQHLRVLADANLVIVRRDGRNRYYRANRAALGPLGRHLEAMWKDQLHSLKRLAEAEWNAGKRK